MSHKFVAMGIHGVDIQHWGLQYLVDWEGHGPEVCFRVPHSTAKILTGLVSHLEPPVEESGVLLGVLPSVFPLPPPLFLVSLSPICLFLGWVGLRPDSLHLMNCTPDNHLRTIIFTCLLL